LRVLYDHQIFSSQPQGGVSRYYFELLKGTEGLGIETETAWRFTSNRYLQGWDGVRFHDWWPSVSFKGKAHLTGILNSVVSRKALASTSWDLFHPTYFDPYFLPYLKGRPFVLTIHDMTHELYPEGLSDRRYLSRRKRLLAGKAARIITVSENTRQDAIRLLGLDPERVVAIPHGNSLRPGKVTARRPPVPGPYWLYVGARNDYKNWRLVVEALALRAQPSDRLVMVGGGALSPAERRALDQAGLGDRAFQTPASDGELAGWYQGAKALIYPSRYEGFGMPLLEAMAWGCPVAAARSSCLPEIGGDAALYFDPDSPQALAQGLDQLEDPDLRRTLVDRGRIRELDFTWDRAVRTTMAVYQGAL
jgi:glycosyltransferase involved in cell wall biosynthesis